MAEENNQQQTAAQEPHTELPVAWYVIHTQTGYENKVSEQINRDISTENSPVKGLVLRALVHTQRVKDSALKKEHKVKCFPGYVLVEMTMDPRAYWFIRNVTGVSGFLGDPTPVPLPQEEIDKILEAENDPDRAPIYLKNFKRGDSVLITEGPFKHFIGTVEEVHEQKHKLNVIVTVFDRATPVEVDFLQVEKN